MFGKTDGAREYLEAIQMSFMMKLESRARLDQSGRSKQLGVGKAGLPPLSL